MGLRTAEMRHIGCALFVMSAAILATTALSCENSQLGCLKCTDEATCNTAGCSFKQVSIFGGKCLSATIATAVDKANQGASKWTKCKGKTGSACAAPDCALVGAVCMPKAAADKANAEIATGSAELKKLGADMSSIMKGIFNDGQATADQIKEKLDALSGKDLASIASGLSEQVKNGKVSQQTLAAVIEKMKGSTAWGAVSTWDVDKIEEAGNLLDGLRAAELGQISEENFEVTIAKFGEIQTWAKDQVTQLASKFAASAGDAATISAEALNSAKGFLSGLGANTLQSLSETEFVKAKDSFKAAANKLGAFDSAQVQSMASKVKSGLGDLAALSAATATDYGSLMGMLSATDLQIIPATAMAGMKAEAIRVMSEDSSKLTGMTKEQLKSMGEDAQKAVNGAGLKALSSDLDKVKAVLGCADDVAKCPAAVTDIVIKFDSTKSTATEMLAQAKTVLQTSGQDYSTCTSFTCQRGIQSLDTGVVIQLPTAAAARRASSSDNMQTTVRVNAESLAAANAAATATGALGASSTVSTTTTTSSPTITSAADQSRAVATASLMMAAAAACMLM